MLYVFNVIPILYVRVCMGLFVCLHVHMCTWACVHVCDRVCMRVRVYVCMCMCACILAI